MGISESSYDPECVDCDGCDKDLLSGGKIFCAACAGKPDHVHQSPVPELNETGILTGVRDVYHSNSQLMQYDVREAFRKVIRYLGD